MTWENVTEITYLSWAQSYAIKDKTGQSMWVYPFMNGFDHFMGYIQKERPALIKGFLEMLNP